jgi:hypothetical protein
VDSYPERIEQSTFKTLDYKHKNIVDNNIKKLESLEFGNDKDKIGVWLYKAPLQIKHPPFKERDKGYLLLAIVNDNEMTTLYWKHRKEGEYDMSIDLDKLIEFSESEFYDPVKKPITIKNIKAWKRSLEEPKKTKESFKKLKLSNGNIIRYYKNSNKFETFGGQPINIESVFKELPDDVILNVISKSTDDKKLELIDLIPPHLSDDAEKLLEEIRNNPK